MWVRNCPNFKNNSKCEKEIIHTNKWNCEYARKGNRECRSCSHQGIHIGMFHSLETRKKLSIDRIGKSHTEETKQKMRGKGNGMYGKHHSKETIDKISNNTKQSIQSDEIREKMRLSAIKRLKHQGIVMSFNPKACEFINKLNKEKGWNLQHAMNGGEIEVRGYYIDGYDKENNIVVEYDERRHYCRGKLREKDIKRMNEIKSHLGCKFLRFNEYVGELKEF